VVSQASDQAVGDSQIISLVTQEGCQLFSRPKPWWFPWTRHVNRVAANLPGPPRLPTAAQLPRRRDFAGAKPQATIPCGIWPPAVATTLFMVAYGAPSRPARFPPVHPYTVRRIEPCRAPPSIPAPPTSLLVYNILYFGVAALAGTATALKRNSCAVDRGEEQLPAPQRSSLTDVGKIH